jgi:hypothetical protein
MTDPCPYPKTGHASDCDWRAHLAVLTAGQPWPPDNLTAPLTGVEVRHPYDAGGILPGAVVTLRNDTGRPLRIPDEAHLLTVVYDP